MDIEIVERAQRGLENRLAHMPHLIDKIRFRRKPLVLENCYSSLASDHIAQGIYDYFIAGNLQSFKQNLHVAVKLDIASITIKDYHRFTIGSEILYALLSDNPDLIDTIAKLEPPFYKQGRSNPLHTEFLVHMYQLAIQGEYETLQTKVDRLGKNGRKKERLLATQGKDFFSLLMRGDKQGLEDLVFQNSLVKSEAYVIDDFMSYQGTMQAKLCWFKGIQVQIESPLLSMTLMPIEPLVNYDDVYDFLAPDYVPPKVNLIERLQYWYKERVRNKASMNALLEAMKNREHEPERRQLL
jgi:hypothetical protein